MDISDASNYPGHADQVFSPRDEEELAAILARASQENVPITVMGAMTGLAGGASPQGGWGVSMTAFRRLEVPPGRATVGVGMLLREVQAAARGFGAVLRARSDREHFFDRRQHRGQRQRVAQFSLWRRRGPMCWRSAWCLWTGASSNIAAARPIDFEVPRIPLPRSTKHSAGYRLAPGMDFVDLFVGSEGTLGVVTQAELQLLARAQGDHGRRSFLPVRRSRARCRGTLAARAGPAHAGVSGPRLARNHGG